MSFLQRALIIEDDRSWQQILAEILTDAGLAVDLAVNLEEAIASMRGKAHRVAVVDLSLDERDHHNRDGLRALDALRYHDPNCQTILLTGFATVELAVSALTEHGALTCLRKETFQRAEFRELVRRALAMAPPVSPGAGQGAAPNRPGVNATQDESMPPARATSQRVAGALVVEDDAGWRGIFTELLADAGIQVRLCSSAGEALGCLRRERYSVAVIDLSLIPVVAEGYPYTSIPDTSIRDTRFPEADFHETSFRLLASARASGIPTIVVSGVATPKEIERAYAEQGIFAYLQKQVFNRQLFIRTILDAAASAANTSALDPASAAAEAAALATLTSREREVLDLLAQGLTNKEIAEALVISANTVKRHLKAIFGKLDIHTRSAAAAKAVGALPTERLPKATAPD